MPLIVRVTSYRHQPPAEPLSRTFDQGRGIIGRGQEADFIIPDPDKYLSRKHALISYAEGVYYITDLGGRNRILVNAQPLAASQKRRLADGDVLGMGEYTLEVRLTGGSFAAAPEPDLAIAAPQALRQGAAASALLATSLPPLEDFEPFGLQAKQPLRELEDTLGDVSPLARGSADAHVPAIMTPMPGVNPIPEDYDFLRGSGAGLKPSAGDAPTLVPESAASASLGVGALPPSPPGVPASAPTSQRLRRHAQSSTPAVAVRPSRSHGQPERAAAEAGEALAAGIRALLAGAGTTELEIPANTHAALMQTVGELLRAFVQGTVEVLLARTLVREEMRARSRTLLRPRDNNPLKFAPPDEALRHLLAPRSSGYLPPVSAVKEAFSDLKAHELAMMAGMRAALVSVLNRYSPAELEKRLPRRSSLGAVMPARRKAKLWDLFTDLYAQVTREAEDDFQKLFGEAFMDTYEAQLARLRAGPHKGGAGGH